MTPRGISATGRAELALVSGRRRFVTPDNVSAELGVEPSVATRKLANWAEKGWLRRVQRGLYIPVPVSAEHPGGWREDALLVGAAVWSPCYFTGWTAANRWGLTEQTFRTTVLKSTRRVRRSHSDLLGVEYLVVYARPALLEWGLRSVWEEEVQLRIADPARVIVDALDEPRLAGGIRLVAEFLSAYLEEYEPALLVDYGDRLGNHAIFKRLGYLLEQLDLDQSELLAECTARRSAGIVMLDPGAPGGGPRNADWRLRANVKVSREDPS